MFAAIFWFELKYWLRNPSFYFFTLILFVLALLLMGASAGLFDAAQSQRVADSPYGLFTFILLFTKLILFIIPAIVGNSVYRDFKSRSHQVMYTFPFTKGDYLAAKFLSALLIVCSLAATIVGALYLGTKLPGTKPHLLVHSGVETYILLFVTYFLPTILLFGSIVFVITTLSRNIYAGFITIAVLLIGRELLAKLTGGSALMIAALLEPLGETATFLATKNWTLADQNQNALPLGGIIAFNRVVGIAIAGVVLAITYARFSFSQLGSSFSLVRSKPSRQTKNNFGSLIKIKLSRASFHFHGLHQLRLIGRLSQIDFRYILQSGSFISMALIGGILVVVLLTQMNPPYETRILPATWVMLAFPIFFYSLLINFLTFLYAGILIHRGRNTRMNELLDVTPVSNVIFVLAKFVALVKMQLVLLAIIFLSGIAVQVYSGYYDFQWGHYAFDLFVIHLSGFMIWAMMAVLVHSAVTNSFVALFLLILGFFGVSQLPSVGIDSLAILFNQDIEPGFFMKYSDMNGHGHSLTSYFTLKAYWLLVGVLLLIGAMLAWTRGTSQTVMERITLARERVMSQVGIALVLVVVLVGAAGWAVHQMENTIHVPSEAELKQIVRAADKKYGHLHSFMQPRIVNVDVTLHLYPETNSFQSTGVYTLVNKTNKPIDTLLVNYSHESITSYRMDVGYETVLRDSVAKLDVNQLQNPLAPGDSLHLHFQVNSLSNTWLYQNSTVLSNGTFITSLIYPGIGYYSAALRKNATDSLARQNHYRSIDSDYISFRATVSTSADQVAIAPGYLAKKWQAEGRNFFHYQSTTPVTNDYVFTSGRYQVLKDRYNTIDLEIYSHPTHTYNLRHLMSGLKSTLAYCEKYFSPYQHKQVRIIEYSRKAGDFAQSFANTIPVSERSFIMDIDEANPQALNLSFLGASHELAHQWWGHQVIPADVNGSRMITESMAEYVSLCVFEQTYGKEKGRLFRKKALDIYLKRRVDDENEKALLKNSGLDKSYIPYQKGSLALYALRHYLGEDNLNRALRMYLEEVKFQQAPYTVPDEMVGFLRQATPDSLRYLVHDLFETVTLYDTYVKGYTATKLPSGKYEVSIELIVSKFRFENGKKLFTAADGTTQIHEEDSMRISSLPLNDYMEIGIYSANGKELQVKNHRITAISNTLKMIVDEAPGSVVPDPNNVLLNMHGKP